MSDMIERVACAMAAAEGWRWEDDRQMLDRAAAGLQNTSRERDTWRNRARAAFEAMHNPSDDVAQAMSEVAIDGPGYVDFYPSLNDCGHLFNAAINEILHGSALSQDTHSLPSTPGASTPAVETPQAPAAGTNSDEAP